MLAAPVRAAPRTRVPTAVAEAERADIVAEAAWWLGRLDDCIAAREDAYQRYEELGDARRAGQCAVWLWEHHAIGARPVIAGGWLRRARRLLEGDEQCAEHVSLLLREAEVAHGGGDLRTAGTVARRALDGGRRLRSADLEAEALQTIGRVLIDEGDLQDGMGHLDEAMLLALQGRLRPFSAGKVYCSMIAACEAVDDFDRAAEWTEATMRWSARHPFAIFPGICRVHRAMVLKRRGSLAEAEEEAARAARELMGSHRRAGIAAFVEIGDIRRRLGHLERAEEAFACAQSLGGGTCGALALLRLAQGRVAEARSIVAGCLRGASKRLDRAALLPVQVHVAVAAGQLDEAAEAAAELEGIVSFYGTHALRATLLSTQGRLELARGDAAAACALLERAITEWATVEAPYEVATARTLLGQALRDSGDEVAATTSFAAAAALFDQIGARLDAPGLPSARRSQALPAGLTERESRSSASSPPEPRTSTSPSGCSSARRPSPATCRTSSPRSRSTVGRGRQRSRTSTTSCTAELSVRSSSRPYGPGADRRTSGGTGTGSGSVPCLMDRPSRIPDRGASVIAGPRRPLVRAATPR